MRTKTESLRDKDQHILFLIVENYLKVGKPVSSAVIVHKAGFPISSATVRNIMVKLEQHEYLYQPHTSAGRIPSDKGLRFYVNNLFKQALSSQVDFLAEELDAEKGDVVFAQASKILSQYSDNIGFVISPRISKMNFRHIRFIKVGENRILLIFVTLVNMVFHEIVETKDYFTQQELDQASRYLNKSYRGRSLLFIQDNLAKEIPKYRIRFEHIFQKLDTLLKAYFSKEENENQIYIEGTSKLLEKPELSDMDHLKSLFKSFEEKTKLAKLLSEFISLERVKVMIGSEINLADVPDCSLILSHYGSDRQIFGSLGIIGPKRIPYKKIIPLVDMVAKRLGQTISRDYS